MMYPILSINEIASFVLPGVLPKLRRQYPNLELLLIEDQMLGASSLLTLIEMVDADLGITFLPEMARRSTLLRQHDPDTTECCGRSKQQSCGDIFGHEYQAP